MILYHFTRSENLESILRDGIIRGDVPTDPTGGFQAPWLTSDTEPATQKWVSGTNKDEIRLTVNVKREEKLRKWSDYAKAIGMEDWWYNALDFTGGGRSECWYIYLGRIPPQWIEKIDYLK